MKVIYAGNSPTNHPVLGRLIPGEIEIKDEEQARYFIQTGLLKEIKKQKKKDIEVLEKYETGRE